MTGFESILFHDSAKCVGVAPGAPNYFRDLYLDQVVAAITVGREEYDLTPFFYTPLRDVESVCFRHEVLRDLEKLHLFDGIKAFALSMRMMRGRLSQSKDGGYSRHQEWWILDAVDIYGAAVRRLLQDLSATECNSRGFLTFKDHLSQYAVSDRFTQPVEMAGRLKAELSTIRYSVLIQGLRVEVRDYAGQPDYSAEVTTAFERFEQGVAQNYEINLDNSLGMNHVEAAILDKIAGLHPELFKNIKEYCEKNNKIITDIIANFDREIQFYIAYLEYIAPLKAAGLEFCYPVVSTSSKEIYDYQGFDLALAAKLVREKRPLICNDFYTEEPERIIVVSGPNQGGKTTFARTFGQLHYLAALGCLVPGIKAQLYLPDRIFTHFEREERVANLRGKLEDDIMRIHDILEAATPESVIIINEIFASTALQDAILLGKKIAEAITVLDALCIWVTFLDELASLNEKTVSMVSTVAPENPTQRTFKIVRRSADGLAYAMAIAEKYRLTQELIKERMRS